MTASTTPPLNDPSRTIIDCTSEQVALQIIRLAAEQPGTCGRLRTARIVGRYPVPFHDEQQAASFAYYGLDLDWPLREIVRLVNALIDGNLLAQTTGPRPTLAATRAGHRVLDALEITSPVH